MNKRLMQAWSRLSTATQDESPHDVLRRTKLVVSIVREDYHSALALLQVRQPDAVPWGQELLRGQPNFSFPHDTQGTERLALAVWQFMEGLSICDPAGLRRVANQLIEHEHRYEPHSIRGKGSFSYLYKTYLSVFEDWLEAQPDTSQPDAGGEALSGLLRELFSKDGLQVFISQRFGAEVEHYITWNKPFIVVSHEAMSVLRQRNLIGDLFAALCQEVPVQARKIRQVKATWPS